MMEAQHAPVAHCRGVSRLPRRGRYVPVNGPASPVASAYARSGGVSLGTLPAARPPTGGGRPTAGFVR